MEEAHTAGIEASCLIQDAQDLHPDAFRKRHGEHFLLGMATVEMHPSGPRNTQLVSIEMEATQSAAPGGGQRVFPLIRTARSIGAFVSIGRTQNNDVVVPDTTVSRFHAFVKTADGQPPTLQDAGSTNGTRVNGASVPTQAEGGAVALTKGDDVLIGSVDFTYLDAEALQDFLRMMAG